MTVSEAMALARQRHQSADILGAASIYRQLLKAHPDYAPAIFHLGIASQELGHLTESLECFRRLVDLKPSDFTANYQLALALHRMGNLTQAADAYRHTLKLKPDDSELHNNLGVALQAQKRTNEAEGCYRRALSLDPNYAEAHNNLGVVLKEQGKPEEAIDCYRRALSLKSNYPQAHNNMGNALKGAGRHQAAIESYQQALRLAPDYVDAIYNLGIAYMNVDRLEEAAAAFRKALRLRPAFPQACNNLGNVLQSQIRFADAADAYREALRLDPNFADAAYNLANALRDHGDLAEAVLAYRRALSIRPDYAEAHNNLANLLVEQDESAQAQVHAREALRCRPDWVPPLFTLVELSCDDRTSLSEEQVSQIKRLLGEPNLAPADSSQLLFAQGQLLDKAKAYDQAFDSYSKGNAIRRRMLQEQGLAFDPAAHTRAIDELVAVFDSGFFERVRGMGSDTELPVFIVGMPRSGTSLVEQIIASHPQVYGAGELREAALLVSGLQEYPGCVASLDRSAIGSMAEQYRQRLAMRGGVAIRVTDKAIQNFLHLGLLIALFPHAKVIHCRRDARDICVSCFLQYFRDLNFTWDLSDLGSYHRQYQRLMQHWRKVLPAQILEVVYEELVEDQESISRKMISHCGLAWDERCLRFHENQRPVQTMSKLQVRQPIYTRSVARWKRYESHLQPLLNALEG